MKLYPQDLPRTTRNANWRTENVIYIRAGGKTESQSVKSHITPGKSWRKEAAMRRGQKDRTKKSKRSWTRGPESVHCVCPWSRLWDTKMAATWRTCLSCTRPRKVIYTCVHGSIKTTIRNKRAREREWEREKERDFVRVKMARKKKKKRVYKGLTGDGVSVEYGGVLATINTRARSFYVFI